MRSCSRPPKRADCWMRWQRRWMAAARRFCHWTRGCHRPGWRHCSTPSPPPPSKPPAERGAGSLLAAGADLARFGTSLLGGAAVPAALLAAARAAGARAVTTYGMTETCGGCIYDGVPLEGVSVRTGTGGRIEITGPVLFSGYRLRPGLTRRVLARGWLVSPHRGPGGWGPPGSRRRAHRVVHSG